MDLGELVFNLNLRTEALMSGAQAAMAKMGELASRQDMLGASSGVLEGKIGVLSAKFERQRETVRQANAAYLEAVNTHGKTSEAAQKAEAALLKEATALQRLAGQLDQASNSAQKLGSEQKQMGIETMAAYTMAASYATQAIRAIMNAIDEGIAAHNRYVASVKGLQSVASGVGIGDEAMRGALAKLTDSFFDTSAAATSLKNLLSRGYTLDQAVNTIMRLKDAAAFGRQASLSLAEAVRSATEGLKNENSILVDNAGVTKNVSKMWEDFAKAQGVGVQSLTQSQKILAEYQGIMHETRYMVGNLATANETLAGAQARAAQSSELLKRAYGSDMSKAVGAANIGLKVFQDIITSLVVAFPGLSSGITTTALAAGGLFVFSKVAILMQDFIVKINSAAAATTGFAGAINSAMPWMLAITAALGIGVGVYTAIADAAEKAAKAQDEAKKKRQDELRTNRETLDSLEDMLERYEALAQKKELSYSETREMRNIEQELVDKYKVTIGVLGDMADSYDTVAAAIRNVRSEKAAEMQATLDANLAGAKKAMADADAAKNQSDNVKHLDYLVALSNAYADLSAKANGAEVTIADVFAAANKGRDIKETTEAWAAFTRGLDRAELSSIFASTGNFITLLSREISEAEGLVTASSVALKNTVKASMESVENQLIGLGLPSIFTDTMRQMIESFDFSGGFDADVFMDKYAAVLKNADVMPAVDAMKELNERILSGGLITEADQSKYVDAYKTLYNALIGPDAAGILPSYTSGWQTFFDTMTNGLLSVTNESKTNADALKDYWASISREVSVRLSNLGVDELIGRVEKSTDELRNFTEDANELRKVKDAIALLDASTVDWALPYAQQGKAIQEAIDILEDYYDVVLDSPDAYAAITKTAESQKRALDASRQSLLTYYEQVSSALETMKASGKDSDGSALTERELAALQSAIDSYALARLALVQALDAGVNAYNREFFDAAISGAQDLSKSMRSLETDISDAQTKMDVLSALQLYWGETQNKTFTEAMDAAEKLYGYRMTSQDQVNRLMVEERGKWDDIYVMWQAQKAAYNTTLAMLQTIKAGYKEGSAEAKQLDLVIRNLQDDSEALTRAANTGWSFSDEAKIAIAAFGDMKKGIDDVGKALEGLKGRQSSISSAQAVVKEAQRLKKAGQEVADTWRSSVSAALGKEFVGTLDDAEKALAKVDLGAETAFKGMLGQLDAWETTLRTAMAGEIAETLKINPNATVDTSKYEAALAVINYWRGLLGLPGYKAPDTKRGGGGGGQSKYAKEISTLEHEIEMGRASLEKQLATLEALDARFRTRSGKSTLKLDDQRDLEQRLYDIKEEIRQRDLDAAYDAIEHRKALNDLSVADEIAALEAIRREHALTAEELLSWDELYYDAKEALRLENLNKELDTLNHQKAMGELTVDQEIAMLQAIIEAHELTVSELWDIQERLYDLQKQKQDEALAGQVETVKSAYGKIVDALRAKYAAEKKIEQDAVDEKIRQLQGQTEAENEERRVQDYNEKVADLQRRLRLTKSAGERRDLQKQLDDLVEAERLRLLQAERQKEIDLLRDEKAAIDDKYAQLTDEENLRQEALRLVMSNNLQAMTELIASYGSEWEDAGASLAEYLTTGLTNEKQKVVDALGDLLQTLKDSVVDQIGNIAAGLPGISSKSINVQMNGTVIREEADIKKIAAAFAREVERSEN